MRRLLLWIGAPTVIVGLSCLVAVLRWNQLRLNPIRADALQALQTCAFLGPGEDPKYEWVRISREQTEFAVIQKKLETILWRYPQSTPATYPISIHGLGEIPYILCLNEQGKPMSYFVLNSKFHWLEYRRVGAPANGFVLQLTDADLKVILTAVEPPTERDLLRTVLYPTGEQKARGSWFKSVPHGPWVYFRKNGERESWGDYTMGRRSGIWTFVDGQGHETHVDYSLVPADESR